MDEETRNPPPATEPAPKAKTLGPLRMIWREALKYPRQLVFAALALLTTSAATLAIPSGFRLIIDKGFAAGANVDNLGRWFQYLLLIVLVLAIGTACRFYFVSWLGERVAQPTLLVHDRGDLTAPVSGSETLLAGLAAGRLHVTENLGHRRLLSDPAVMEQVLGHFLMAGSAVPALRVV